MNVTSTQVKDIKESLCSMIACEMRSFLYDSLVKDMDRDRVFTMLAIAEKKALKSVKSVQVAKLFD